MLSKFNILLLVFSLFFVFSCSDAGKKEENKPQKTDLCKNVNCSLHGTCKILNEEAYCDCETGYTNGENKLTCVDKNDDFNLNGIYEVVVNGSNYVTYTGKVEIRPKDNSKFEVIHLIEYDNAKFEGLNVAQAWIGELDSDNFRASVTLYRKGFITKYNNLTRTIDSPYKTICTSNLTRENNVLTANFNCENAQNFNFNETWTRVADNGESPIWKNERLEIESHEEISQTAKERRFQLYKSFHELPTIAPYVDREDFKRAMHFYIYDPTDLQYYKNNPNKLRVIQKTIDDISLKETKQRRDAYYMTLAQKQSIYEAEMQTYFLNEKGMYSNYDSNNNMYHPSGDGLLWTGVYVASQAMRYLKTNSTEALQNMIRSLQAQITCFNITNSDATFARSIRAHQDSAVDCSGNPDTDNGKWCKGSGVYADTDYLMSGNNDMFKGYIVAFPWAYKALKKAGSRDNLIKNMAEVMGRLVEHNSVAGDRKINEFLSYLMLYMLEDSFLRKQEYKARYESVWSAFVDPWLVDQGNGAKYDYGTADWSGTHLNIQTLISSYIMFDEVGDDNKKHAISVGFKRALDNMRFTNQGLFQLAASTLGDFSVTPDEQMYSLWYLQSYIAPKKNIDFDWRINPEYSMSPYPNLPWKNDWTEPNTDRSNSLRMYPNFEQNVDDFMFKSSPFNYKGSAKTAKEGNADYLFAYWFARYFDVINEND